MPRIQVVVENDNADVRTTLPDARQLLEPAARMLVALVKLGFKTSTAPTGERWAPLKFRSGQPLRDKGLLQNSFFTRYGNDYVDVGTSRVGARAHQFGATIRPVRAKMLRFFPEGSKVPIFRKSVKVPARPFLPLDSAGNLVLPDAWERSFLATVRARLEGKKGAA